mmetsp:Transcript_68979/g.222957  ORF Transcript_68979/g.222957 Transcript_68979/m.222957 type:complete len:574 (-) Transcript_68979:466-2187(-)
MDVAEGADTVADAAALAAAVAAASATRNLVRRVLEELVPLDRTPAGSCAGKAVGSGQAGVGLAADAQHMALLLQGLRRPDTCNMAVTCAANADARVGTASDEAGQVLTFDHLVQALEEKDRRIEVLEERLAALTAAGDSEPQDLAVSRCDAGSQVAGVQMAMSAASGHRRCSHAGAVAKPATGVADPTHAELHSCNVGDASSSSAASVVEHDTPGQAQVLTPGSLPTPLDISSRTESDDLAGRSVSPSRGILGVQENGASPKRGFQLGAPARMESNSPIPWLGAGGGSSGSSEQSLADVIESSFVLTGQQSWSPELPSSSSTASPRCCDLGMLAKPHQAQPQQRAQQAQQEGKASAQLSLGPVGLMVPSGAIPVKPSSCTAWRRPQPILPTVQSQTPAALLRGRCAGSTWLPVAAVSAAAVPLQQVSGNVATRVARTASPLRRCTSATTLVSSSQRVFVPQGVTSTCSTRGRCRSPIPAAVRGSSPVRMVHPTVRSPSPVRNAWVQGPFGARPFVPGVVLPPQPVTLTGGIASVSGTQAFSTPGCAKPFPVQGLRTGSPERIASRGVSRGRCE